MADNVDVAAERIEWIARHQLAFRHPEAPHGQGLCLNCAEPLTNGHRWCDRDCKEDWEKRQCRRT